MQGMRMYNYNPLCGGLLTGKYKSMKDDEAKAAGLNLAHLSIFRLTQTPTRPNPNPNPNPSD